MTNDYSHQRTHEVLARTSRAAVMAHDANLRAAVDGVEWERRGLLRALTRRRREDPPRKAA
ncbi:MAG: hypothetical protein QOC77_3269 [Thermoleophilaceae bacterium]|jgi:hypothetical protein|nr:hypothetical protein [Thermoleophilaceae bacterium]MEA2471629.1 hypothetical protein [Thermoleophilaceae bacterium]